MIRHEEGLIIHNVYVTIYGEILDPLSAYWRLPCHLEKPLFDVYIGFLETISVQVRHASERCRLCRLFNYRSTYPQNITRLECRLTLAKWR